MFLFANVSENTSEIIKNIEKFPIAITPFVISSILAFLLAKLLGYFYLRFGKSQSNHSIIASVFPLLCITTTLVIAVVKSSLALSLGLVGALSIVRFRTPIKEPEELTYLFLCIAIGLGLGSEQYLATMLGLSVALLAVYFDNKNYLKFKESNLLNLNIKGIETSKINEFMTLVKKYSRKVYFNNLLLNKDENNYEFTSLNIKFMTYTFDDIDSLVNEINKIFPKCSVSIIEPTLN